MNTFKTPRHYIHPSNKPPPKIEANFNLATDFPSLSSSSSSSLKPSISTTTTPSTIDYSHTFAPTETNAKPINLNPPEPTIPPPGWHKYTCNKTTHVITADYGKNCHNINMDTRADLNKDPTNHNFIKMMQHLENAQLHHAEQFIECYGYDCYERTFLMPNYTPQYFSDSSDRDSNSNSDYYSSEDDR